MVPLIGSVLAGIVATIMAFKVWDALRAWKYNRRRQHRMAVVTAFWEGHNVAMGEWARKARAAEEWERFKVQTEIDRMIRDVEQGA